LNSFRIFAASQFTKDLDHDFGGQRERISDKLKYFVYPQLQENPYFGKNIKKLKNHKPDTWRYRIGDYRFFYEIDDKRKIVFMTAADSRGNAY